LEAAFRTYQEGLDFVSQIRSGVVLSTAVAHVGMAEVLYERNQLDQALLHAREGISLGRQLTATQALAAGLAVLAWIRQASGNPEGAREAMDEANQVMPSPEIVALHNPVPAERAKMLIIQGQIQEAARWVEARGLRWNDETSFTRELEYLVLARILLRKNMSDRALALLERLGAEAEEQGRIGSLIEVQILQALAFRATGKLSRALNALAQALGKAEPEGYMRIFIGEGREMAALLHEVLSRGVAKGYTARLLSAFSSTEPGIQPAFPAGPYSFKEPLSERELEVLQLLVSGASTKKLQMN
jgi:LuxR family maltose regulon positive regulatory protein